LQEPSAAALDAIAARAVAAAGDPTSATTVLFLLRHYLASGSDGAREALGIALAHALDRAADEPSIVERAAWLALFVEATAIADDDRVAAAAQTLAASLSSGWPAADGLRDGLASVDACLHASTVVDSADLVSNAVDELERIVGGAYRPGEGLLERGSAQAGSAAHVRAAQTLLTAFEYTGRLPYSMLAEELMQITRRRLADEAEFVTCCHAARALCRLAALHDAADYRAAAIVASDADYRGDAARLLQLQAPRVDAAPLDDAALYGVALRELLSLR
jgi:hypothetical protein